MYKHILNPTDGSPLSEQATTHAITLARAVGARVTAVTVSVAYHTFALDPVMVSDTAEQYEKDCQARAERYLAPIQQAAKAAGVPCDTVHVVAEHAYQAIIDTARARGCDLIVMASHGRKGISALVLGSETVKVLTHSKIPVLVCR
jgi:nucleotide-binding universal stress UspA family protein